MDTLKINTKEDVMRYPLVASSPHGIKLEVERVVNLCLQELPLKGESVLAVCIFRMNVLEDNLNTLSSKSVQKAIESYAQTIPSLREELQLWYREYLSRKASMLFDTDLGRQLQPLL